MAILINKTLSIDVQVIPSLVSSASHQAKKFI